jgi:CspA family cold shock protein
MGTVGVVREWREDEGWGVVDSPETPGGCWAHFGAGAIHGYVAFRAGERVHLEWEAVGQDGFDFRATRLWPEGREPETRPRGDSAAYTSSLTLIFDERD